MTETRLFRIAVAVALVHALDDAFVHRGARPRPRPARARRGARARLASRPCSRSRRCAGPARRARARVRRPRGGQRHAARHAHRRARRRGGDLTGVLAVPAASSRRPRRRDPVAPPRRGARLDEPRGRRAGRSLALLLVLGPSRWTSSRPTSGASRSATRRAPPTRRSPSGRGRARPRGLVPAVEERRGGARRARRQQRPQGLGRPRRAARPPRLRRAALRRPRARRERRQREQLRLGLGRTTSPARSLPQERDDVDPDRIGALGLSTGADVLIEVAAERAPHGAVVADGAAAGSFEDGRRLTGRAGTPLVLGHVHHYPRALGRPARPAARGRHRTRASRRPCWSRPAGAMERDFNVLYDGRGTPTGRALEPARRTPHRARARAPADYEQRVVAFFDDALQ